MEKEPPPKPPTQGETRFMLTVAAVGYTMLGAVIIDAILNRISRGR